MSEWRLTREIYGNEEYKFKEGDEVTIGRDVDNTISLNSFIVSRKHCVLNAYSNKVVITDMASSNGVYVGHTKIPQNTPYDVKDCDRIGIGWTLDPFTDAVLKDRVKYFFKLTKESSIKHKLHFENENELDQIEQKIVKVDSPKISLPKTLSPILPTRLPLKKKSAYIKCNKVINLPSNSGKEIKINEAGNLIQEFRLKTIDEKCPKELSKNHTKCDNEYLEEAFNANQNKNRDFNDEPIVVDSDCDILETIDERCKEVPKDDINFKNDVLKEAFNVEQECMRNEDELIVIDSDTDGESSYWYIRLSKNLHMDLFSEIETKTKNDDKPDDNSYNPTHDNIVRVDNENEEEFMNDIIIIPPIQPKIAPQPVNNMSDIEEFSDDSLMIPVPTPQPPLTPKQAPTSNKDEIDVSISNQISKELQSHVPTNTESTRIVSPNNGKKTQMVKPLINLQGKMPLLKVNQVHPNIAKSRKTV